MPPARKKFLNKEGIWSLPTEGRATRAQRVGKVPVSRLGNVNVITYRAIKMLGLTDAQKKNPRSGTRPGIPKILIQILSVTKIPRGLTNPNA
jgi:hypothetical protein